MVGMLRKISHFVQFRDERASVVVLTFTGEGVWHDVDRDSHGFDDQRHGQRHCSFTRVT